VCIGLDKLSDGEPVRGLLGRDDDVLAHEWAAFFDRGLINPTMLFG
jgi:hypothetical protein